MIFVPLKLSPQVEKQEGAALALIFIFGLYALGPSVFSLWGMALLFFAPDLSFLAYLAGPKIGARVYNAAHSYLCAMPLMVVGWYLDNAALTSIALIWAAHIAFDRGLGFGLKFDSDFKDTHLGKIGKDSS